MLTRRKLFAQLTGLPFLRRLNGESSVRQDYTVSRALVININALDAHALDAQSVIELIKRQPQKFSSLIPG